MITTASEVTSILSELTGLGIELRADDDRLRYRPRDRMTPELLQRIKAHKTDLLALLRAGDAPAAPEKTTVKNAAPTAVYRPKEKDVLAKAGIKPGDVLLENIKDAFPNAEVIHARRIPPRTPRTLRQQVADLLRQARRSGPPDLAVALRDSWHERMAICTIDGGLNEEQAEYVAIEEIKAIRRQCR